MKPELYSEIDRLKAELADETALHKTLSKMHDAAKQDWRDERERLKAENKQLKETIERNQKTNVEVYSLLQENKRLRDLLAQTFLEGPDGPARRRIKRIDWNSDGTVDVEME